VTGPTSDGTRPSPARRARRIGGRPAPGSTPRPAEQPIDAARDTTVTEQAAPIELSKPVAEKTAPKPTRAPDFDVDTAAEAKPGRAIPLRWIPTGLLGICVLALLVLLVIASHGVYWAKADDSASARTVRQEEVLAAAKKCFAQINTYDYRHLDGLISTDLKCTTGRFSADLRQALQSQILRLAPKAKATQAAQVNKAGIVSVNPAGDQVVLLVYGQLTQSNSSTAKKSPRVDVVGAVVTVDKVGQRWLISKVATDVGNSLGS
jgi:Mce-associated membrane protein